MSDGIIGKGTILAYESGTSYIDLLEVTSCSDPKPSVDEVELTHFLSPDGYREFIPTWIDASEISVEGNYLADQTETLFGLIGVVTGWQLTKSDGSVWTFDGWIKQMENDNDYQSKCTTKLTIRVTGVPDFTPYSEETTS